MNHPMDKENLLTVRAAAEALGVSQTTVRTMISQKEISSVRIRSRWFVFRDGLERYVKENTQERESYND